MSTPLDKVYLICDDVNGEDIWYHFVTKEEATDFLQEMMDEGGRRPHTFSIWYLEDRKTPKELTAQLKITMEPV